MKINDMPISMNLKQYNLQTEKLLEDAKVSNDKETLLKACQSFEALFLEMMQKNMRSTISEDGFIKKSHGREIFEGMYDEKLSQEMTKGKGIGLAQQLYKQLSKSANIQNE